MPINFFQKGRECGGRKRDRKATELALLNSASKLFAEKGYESTRTLDIAKDAGVNEALILRYFGGKEGLLMAIFKNEDFMQVMMQSQVHLCKSEQMGKLLRHKSDLSTEELFKEFFSSSCDQMNLREPFMRIASSRALVDKEMAEVIFNKIIQNQTATMVERLKEYLVLQKISLKEEDVEALAIILSSIDYSMNFMMDRVYKLDRKKIDAVLNFTSKALAGFISKTEQK